jgi:outer membrane protein TolC
MPVFGGRSIPLLSNAYDAVEIAKKSSSVARDQLLFAATQAYYGAVTAKKMTTIAEKQLKNAREHRDDIAKRVELGAMTKLALQRAELDVVRAEQQVRVAKQGVASALGSLGVLMDRDTQFDVVEPEAPRAIESDATADELALRAMGGRTDVDIQKIALRIAERTQTDAWAMFLPSVNLSAFGNYTSNTSGLTSVPFTGGVSLSVNVPIFDGGTRYAALAESRSKLREESLKLQQLRRQVESSVRGNLADIAVKRDALQMATRALELSRATHQNAKDLFDLGAATSLDVIDASLGEFFAEIELARAELDLQQARLGLAFVLGDFEPVSGTVAPARFTDQDRQNVEQIREMGAEKD